MTAAYCFLVMLLLLLPSAVADVPVRGCLVMPAAAAGGRGVVAWHGREAYLEILPGATGHHRRIPWTPKLFIFSGIWVTGGGVGMPRRCEKICLEQPP